MTAIVAAHVEEFITLRQGLGYRSPSQERALRAFGRHLDRRDHKGPIALESSLECVISLRLMGNRDPRTWASGLHG